MTNRGTAAAWRTDAVPPRESDFAACRASRNGQPGRDLSTGAVRVWVRVRVPRGCPVAVSGSTAVRVAGPAAVRWQTVRPLSA
ncbi:hypothetical protein [Streptomyces abyssomicinicus]|uniref:hypothetical protein n=1 Tax=Streptomyces abyssomicinicus TaxID=574929 RepID=UPI001250C125|nr:hypothetical protein [Streptomyces abyssomicinicus]